MKLKGFGNKQFTALGSALSGCSSRAQEITAISAIHKNSRDYLAKQEALNAIDHPNGALLSSPRSHLMSMLSNDERGTIVWHPTAPGFGNDDKNNNPSRQQYRLCREGQQVAIFDTHVKCLALREDAKKHLPRWLLRPYELIDAAGLLEQGALRQVLTHSRRVNGGFRYEQEPIEYPKKYGFGGTKYKGNPYGSRHYTYTTNVPSYYGRVKRFRLWSTATIETIFQNQFDDRHTAGDWHNPTMLNFKGSMAIPWWLSFPLLGMEPPSPDELIDKTLKSMDKRLAKRDGLGLIAGNWYCSNPVNSIRIALAFAEAGGWKNPMDSKQQMSITTPQKRTLYYRMFPSLWESPGHSYHPIFGMVFSYTPITWEKLES